MRIINYKLLSLSMFLMLLYSCSKSNVAKIENLKKGTLNGSVILEITKTKRFNLDEDSAPAPQYMQMFRESTGDYLTFLNSYTNSIYFYDYNKASFVKKISYKKKEPNGILRPMGYHIKNLDSIYLYDFTVGAVKITNSKGEVYKTISLHGKENSKTWFLNYPQYIPTTVTPFIETNNELLFTGQCMGTVPEDKIDTFKFTARIDFATNQVRFANVYPKDLYGNKYNWEGEIFTTIFSTIHPDGDKLICSFPVSHNLRIINLSNNRYRDVYAGSNEVGSINSIDKDPKKVSREDLMSQVVKQNEYAAILYDKYRKIYYRFLLKGIPNADDRSTFKDKPIAVIVMDNNFNYLGETTLGLWKVWNWRNSFVTEEGLNIEYLGDNNIDESTMTLKILTIKKVTEIFNIRTN